jgi:hypothetical protein
LAINSGPFQTGIFETYRRSSEEIFEEAARCMHGFERDGDGVVLEVAALELLLSNPKVQAWESATRAVAAGLGQPGINNYPEMQAFFIAMLEAIEKTAELHGESISELVSECVRVGGFEKSLIAKVGQRNGFKPHANNRASAMRIPFLWKGFKAEGMSKNQAAPLIAKAVNLSLTTVRKKLQGI